MPESGGSQSQIEIYVDADACPVKSEAVKVADRHRLTIHFVSNQFMRLPEGYDVRRIVVSDAFDAADDWIADTCGPNTIVITADIPLAARALKTGAHALGPTGRPFDDRSIGNALAMRDLSAHLRETGAIAGANPAFSKQDRSRFLQALENTIQAIKRTI